MTIETKKTIEHLKSSQNFQTVSEYVEFYNDKNYPLCDVKLRDDEIWELTITYELLKLMDRVKVGFKKIDLVKDFCKAMKNHPICNSTLRDAIYIVQINNLLCNKEFCKTLEPIINEYNYYAMRDNQKMIRLMMCNER